MNKSLKTLLIVFLASFVGSVSGQQLLSIEDIIAKAKEQSPFFKQAETRKENRYWAYRFYKTTLNPQLRLSGNVPAYTKAVNQWPDNGTFIYRPSEFMNNNLNLGLIQPLSFTGGTISANTGLGYYRNYQPNENEDPVQWSGSVFNIAINQPIFAFNQLRWDKRIEPLRYEESKRDYVEQMEFLSSEAVDRFFNVLTQQVNLQVATFNLANNDTIYKIEQGRYNIGTTSLDKLLQVELQLLSSRKDVAQASLDLETARLQLRTFIGLGEVDQFQLVLPEAIPQFTVTIDEALQHAKTNRSAFIAFQRRRIENERDVAQARGRRFQTSVTAAFGLNNNGFDLNDIYQDPTEQQQVSLSFSVPVLDWGRNKSMMRTALANKKLNDYLVAQDEVNFEQEIITKVRQFEMMRLQIEITKKSDQVASERYNVAQNRYLIGKIDITNLNIALTEKDNAKRSYIQALKDFWTAYYDMRRLTLYDFSARRLLYTPEE
jgi:outer membrane protein TolC